LWKAYLHFVNGLWKLLVPIPSLTAMQMLNVSSVSCMLLVFSQRSGVIYSFVSRFRCGDLFSFISEKAFSNICF